MKNTLRVRNIEQAACWLELDGQLSDGFWENARPYDHWKPLAAATVVVAAPGEGLGRDFYTPKTNYNFTSPELLKTVGRRMLGLVRIARVFGLATAAMLEHDVTLEGTIEWNRTADHAASYAPGSSAHLYWSKRAEDHAALDQKAIDAALADPTYTRSMMFADLKELKATLGLFWKPVARIVPTEAQMAAADAVLLVPAKPVVDPLQAALEADLLNAGFTL